MGMDVPRSAKYKKSIGHVILLPGTLLNVSWRELIYHQLISWKIGKKIVFLFILASIQPQRNSIIYNGKKE